MSLLKKLKKSVKKVVRFEAFNLKKIGTSIRKNPLQFALGAADELSAGVWNKLGANFVPVVTPLGAPVASTFAEASAAGIDIRPAQALHQVAEVVAGSIGGAGLARLGTKIAPRIATFTAKLPKPLQKTASEAFSLSDLGISAPQIAPETRSPPPPLPSYPPGGDMSLLGDLAKTALKSAIQRRLQPTPASTMAWPVAMSLSGPGDYSGRGVIAPAGRMATLYGGLPALPGAGFKTGGFMGGTSSGSFPTYGDHPRGYHWTRTGKLVKNRRMNPCNVRALRRSLRRVESFVRIEKRVDKIVNRAARSARTARSHGFVRSKARR